MLINGYFPRHNVMGKKSVKIYNTNKSMYPYQSVQREKPKTIFTSQTHDQFKEINIFL